MMPMYRWIRTTHLCLGLFALFFLLMYGITGVQMSHDDWFDLEPTVSESRLTVSGDDARVVARQLMDRRDMSGELRRIRMTDEGFEIQIVRPGTQYDVTYSRTAKVATVRTSKKGFLGTLNRLHHIGGLQHKYGLLNFWGMFVALVSLGLLLLGASGVYMWFKHRLPAGRLLHFRALW